MEKKKRLLGDRNMLSYDNKLRIYKLFKDNFKFEDYLTMSTANQRRIITKFRISAHKLEIERGRYFNVPVERRICKICKLDIENEIHFSWSVLFCKPPDL